MRRALRLTAMRVHRASPDSEAGQAILEFAGALLVLMLLVVGIFDFAPALVRSAQLTQAVRDGVTYARTAPNDEANIKARVRRSATVMDIPADTITVTCRNGLAETDGVIPCSSARPGHSVEVQAQFNYQPLTLQFSQLTNAPIELIRRATSEIY